MNEKRLLDTFFELVKMDSVSRNEKAVADYCASALEAAGCTVTRDNSAAQTGSNTGNIIADLPGNAPGKIYFSAHMDTVTPGEGIDPYVDAEGIIRSRGETVLGGDDKSGVAAIIELVRVLNTNDAPHPTIGILLSTCEEVNLLGAMAMDASTFNNEPCFVLDCGGSPGVVIIGAPHHQKFTVEFTGVAAHAGVEPEKGVSAIELAAKAINNMELGRLDEHSTANVGSIHGGNADNIVAEQCFITGEFRSLFQPRIDEIKTQIDAAVKAAIQGTAGNASIEWEPQYMGYTIAADDPIIMRFQDLARGLGLSPSTEYTGGGSDANIFAEKGLIPVVLGTGMTNVHSTSEQLAVADLNNTARLCIAIAYGALDNKTIK